MMIHTLRSQTRTILSFSGKGLPKKITTQRLIHLPSATRCFPARTSFLRHDMSRHTNILGVLLIRHNSTTTIDSLPNIPELPAPVLETVENLVQLQPNGDPTFASIGLGGWSPVGILQNTMEAIHVYCNIPWWATIMTTTFLLKLLVLKWHINSQRLSCIQQKHAPKLQKLQKDMMTAQFSGDMAEASLLMQEQKLFSKQIGLSPGKMLFNSGIQAAASITGFIALRQICGSSLESLRTGGFFWVTDLTAPDPFYILPIVSCASIAVLTEVIMLSGGLNALSSYKYLIRIVPLVTLPFMLKFAAGIQLFWLTTNVIVLTQLSILRIPRVRTALNIPPIVQGVAVQGFKEQYQEVMRDMRTRRELKKAYSKEDHLEAAAKMPMQKTYTFNPLDAPQRKVRGSRKLD